MKSPPRDASSTDLLPYALRGDPPADGVATACARLGVPGGAGELEAALRDGKRVDAHLRRLPAMALLALEILVDRGGGARPRSLADELTALTGVADASLALADVALVAPAPAWGQLGTPEKIALLGGAAGRVAAAVRGLTTPQGAPPDDAIARPGSEARALVAFVGLAVHRPMTFTMSAGPNRVAAKRLVKGTGLDVERAVELAQIARRARILLDGALDLDVARAFVSRRMTALPTTADLLPMEGYVSLEACMRSLLRAVGLRYPDAWAGANAAWQRARLRPLVDADPRCVFVEHAGATWIARAPASPARTGDGHVNPNFEVMLGPRCDLETLLTIGVGAELARFDNVLTFRVTPASVADAARLGLDKAELLGALDLVGPRPAPENVRALVSEWFDGAKIVDVATAAILTVSARHEAAITRALGERVLGRIGPGRLVIANLDNAAREALATAAFSLRGAEVVPAARLDASHAYVHPPTSPAALGFDSQQALAGQTRRATPDPELVRVVAEARAAGFPREAQVEIAAIVPAPGQEKATPLKPTEAASTPAKPTEASMSREEALALAAELLRVALTHIKPWRARLPGEAGGVVTRSLEVPSVWAAFSSLKSQAQLGVLTRARTLAEALTIAARLGDDARLRAGKRLTRALAEHGFGDAYVAATLRRLEEGERPSKLAPTELRTNLAAAIAAKEPVRLTWSTPSGQVERLVRVGAVRMQGGRSTFVYVTLLGGGATGRVGDGDEHRALPIEIVRSVKPQ